jgi:hypothetical protein
MVAKQIPEKDVETFYYEGKDEWVDFKKSDIPPCPKAFKAKLKLVSGKTIDAPPDWRKKIWEWWYAARRGELFRDVMQAASRQVAPRRRRRPGRAY